MPTSAEESVFRGLMGKWRKVTTDEGARLYPDDLEFFDAGIYRGSKGEAEAQEFTVWDGGGYAVLAPNRIRISTATDAEIVYEFSLSGDGLTFSDREGKNVTYMRVT